MTDAREVLLRHSRNPERHGALADADARGSCRNPLCGDHVEVALKLKDGLVDDVRVLVSGCGIATASASLMTGLVQGSRRLDLAKLIEHAAATLSATEAVAWPADLESLKPFESLRRNPRKIPCALMAWYALKDALKDDFQDAAVEADRADAGADLRELSKIETTL